MKGPGARAPWPASGSSTSRSQRSLAVSVRSRDAFHLRVIIKDRMSFCVSEQASVRGIDGSVGGHRKCASNRETSWTRCVIDMTGADRLRWNVCSYDPARSSRSRRRIRRPRRSALWRQSTASSERCFRSSRWPTAILNLDPGIWKILTKPKRQIIVSCPVQMDNGADRGLHRLSRAIQHHARAGQGRHPLPPRRHARRSHGAGRVDDVEVRRRAAAVRRRQGRRHLRPDARCRSASSKR